MKALSSGCLYRNVTSKLFDLIEVGMWFEFGDAVDTSPMRQQLGDGWMGGDCSNSIFVDPETVRYLDCTPTGPAPLGPDPTISVITASALRPDNRAHCGLALLRPVE